VTQRLTSFLSYTQDVRPPQMQNKPVSTPFIFVDINLPPKLLFQRKIEHNQLPNR
jgi:hypothetical protein